MHLLHRVSAGWARVEIFVAALMAGAVTGLILLNVVTRSMRRSIYWVDEAAIYAMVIMTFLAASAAIERREAIAITLIVDVLNPSLQRVFWIFVDAVTLLCAVLLLWFCWIWFQPDVLWRTGFDFRDFQRETFNFMYREPTSTLGMQKYWFWLAMPVFALGLFLHALSNLVKTLRGQPVVPAGGRT